MREDQYVISKLIDYLWYHCSHQDAWQGLESVAFVLRNRVNAGWGNWRTVIAAALQYAGNFPTLNQPPSINDALWRKLLTDVDAIYNNTAPDNVTKAITLEGKSLPALYYCNLSEPIRVWFKENILDKKEAHKPMGKVGRLTLFN